MAQVGSPWLVPEFETRAGSAELVASQALILRVLRGCIRFVVSWLLRWCYWLSRSLRSLPHEAGFFFPMHSSTCLICRITINLFQVPREQASS